MALMIDAAATRIQNATGNSGWFMPISIRLTAQLNTGQKVAIGYRPVQAGRNITLVNSNSIIPLILVQEVDAPS
jgi:hypothetical protein